MDSNNESISVVTRAMPFSFLREDFRLVCMSNTF
jgi:hypothetical protein